MFARPSLVAAAAGLLLLITGPNSSAADEPFEVHTLDNGLTILLAPSAAHPVIALSCYVTTGGRTEDEYYQGSLHYIEHLVFKGGTPRMKPTEFRKKMSLLGRESGGWTWDDEINFGFEVPRENFEDALSYFREALLDLEFEEQWFEDEKQVVMQEMTRGREQPDRLVWEFWGESAYQVHPYRRTVIGTEKAVLELDMEKTYEYYRDRFSPNHVILSIAGDFEPDEMIAWVEGVWGDEERGPESFELGFVEGEQRGPRERTDYLPQSSTAITLLGVVAPGAQHQDTPALELLAALMNDPTYGFQQYLTEQERWVNRVSAGLYAKRDASDFTVFFRCAPEKHAAVHEFVEQFLFDFDVNDIPESVFEQTQDALLFQEASQRETNVDRAGRYGFLVSRRGIDGALSLTDQIASLTREDVQRAKEAWIQPRKLVTAHVFPEEWDPAQSEAARVEAADVAVGDLPNLDVPGALRPAEAEPLEVVSEESVDGVHRFTYANGMRLLVQATTGSPLTAISGRVLGGQWVEPEGREGINAFVSELGMRRTRRWNREDFQRLLSTRSIQASMHKSTGSRANTSRHVDHRDAAAHHYVGLGAEWSTMLACLKETLFFPDFDTDEIEKIREQQLTAAQLLPENNLEYIKQEFYKRVFADHPYGRETFGNEESLAAITEKELRAFHAERWRPDRVVVTVVGNVDPAQVAEWVATRWADLSADAAQPYTIDPTRASLAWSPPSEHQILDLGKNYWTVNWGRPGVTAQDAKQRESMVLARMAGNDHFYKYVYGEGVSYRSWINFWSHLGPGAWILENDVKQERFDEILGMFDEDLARYTTDEGFTREEFDAAVQRLVNRSILDAQDNALTAWRLTVAESNGLGFEWHTQLVDGIREVTFEDVKSLAREVFAPNEIYRLNQQ